MDKTLKLLLGILLVSLIAGIVIMYFKSYNDLGIGKLKKSLDSANAIIKAKQKEIKIDSGIRVENDKKKEELVSKLKKDKAKDSLLHISQIRVALQVDKKYQNTSLNKLKKTLDSLYVLDSLSTDF